MGVGVDDKLQPKFKKLPWRGFAGAVRCFAYSEALGKSFGVPNIWELQVVLDSLPAAFKLRSPDGGCPLAVPRTIISLPVRSKESYLVSTV